MKTQVQKVKVVEVVQEAVQHEGVHCFDCGTFLFGDRKERPCPCGGELVLDAMDFHVLIPAAYEPALPEAKEALKTRGIKGAAMPFSSIWNEGRGRASSQPTTFWPFPEH